jgi:hypothetical protein
MAAHLPHMTTTAVRCGSSTVAVAMLTIALMAFWSSAAVRAQSASDGPKWSKRLTLSDGRTFVSDGAIALDASFVKPAGIESMIAVPGAAVERHFQAPFTSEIRASDLAARGTQYVTPEGIPLSALYVDYLRRHVGSRLRLRITGDRQPIVLMLDGRAVGVVMPMAK